MKRTAIFLAVLAGAVYAPLLAFLRGARSNAPVLASFQFLASDAFYYLSIARHSVGRAFFTSDGLFPTNGFHPLWQWILTQWFSIPGPGSAPDLQLQLVFALSALLVALGTALFALVLYGLTNHFTLSLLASVPGLYYLIFGLVAPDYNSTWSFMNGMETPLSVLWFGLLCYLSLNQRALLRSGYAASALLACLVTLVIFARLDDVFLLAPYAFFMLHFSPTRRSSLIRLLIMLGIPGIALLAYGLHNYAYAGSFLPVSGLAKQGSSLAANFYYLLLSFIPVAVMNSDAFWSEGTMRTLQMSVPILLAVISVAGWLKWIRSGPSEAERSDHYSQTVIAGLCLYVILKGAYNLAFVDLWGQGHWYFALSIMIFNLVVAAAIGRRLAAVSHSPRSLVWGTAGLLFVALLGNAFVTHKLLGSYNRTYYDFWIQRSSIQRQLQTLDPQIRIVELDDGPISYALDIPTMSGFGYTLDYEALQAKSRGELLQLAHERGFRVIGLLYYYAGLPPGSAEDPQGLHRIVQSAPTMGAEDLTRWRFSLLYRDPNSRALFIKFEPADLALNDDSTPWMAGLAPSTAE